MKYLTKRQILLLHSQLLVSTGGAQGIHDEGLLESALDSPRAGFSQEEFYPTVESKAARLAFGLVSNHPFVDGNKRIGILAMLVTLEGNGIVIDASNEDLIDLGMRLASGEVDTDGVASWINDHKFM
ncbi:MAG: type II toxin-antitoxin system death-on-curing family toxin [Propionibacteriaceae bacterium]|nr:type II toxin-antitoxin system death-on-curing family toxin [Propionibacteriaceae bacterium]